MKKLLPFLFAISLIGFVQAAPSEAAKPNEAQQAEWQKSVVVVPLEDGVSIDDAIASMKLRANLQNLMLVAEQPLSDQLRKMGIPSRRLEIFQFCDPVTARKMVDSNPMFAAYMPCRIALVEGADGKAQLMMMNLDPLIQASNLSPDLNKLAKEVSGKLLDIMQAGATGDL